MSKSAEIRALLDRLNLDAVLLGTPANFAWYTGGANNRVDHSSPVGVASVLVTRDDEYVVTDNIEAERMRREQTPDIEVVEFPWYEGDVSVVRELVSGGELGSDLSRSGARNVSGEISPLRHALSDRDIERYREVGRDASEALDEAASQMTPEMTGYEAVGVMISSFRSRGMFTPVAVAAGANRASLYRHAIPSVERLGERVTIGVCAERGGLFANLTRHVDFEEPSPDLRRRFEACRNILTRMREEATVPGRSLAEVFEDCRRFYAEEGFADEWRLHHQGGMTGYASREVIASPTSDVEVETGQAFAWNPTITGAKAEETFVIVRKDDGYDSQPLTF